MPLWFGLLWKYSKLFQDDVEDLSDSLRTYNSRNRYDNSVEPEELARDFLIPVRDDHVIRFARNNDVEVSEYIAEVHGNLELPRIIWSIVFLVFCIFYALSGITFLLNGGFIPPMTFLQSLFALAAINILLYLFLRTT